MRVSILVMARYGGRQGSVKERSSKGSDKGS